MGDAGQRAAVLVPIKPFAAAKSRLAPACSPSQREHLARAMARTVLKAANGLRTAVVAPAEATDVRRFALINGARFFSEPTSAGVNGAVAHGVDRLAELGYERIIVAMSDLPLVKDLRWLAEGDGVTVVADRTGRGTNALSIPSDAGFLTSFGPGSLERHVNEARRMGLEVRTAVDPEAVSSDVDEIDDAMRAGVFLANDPITQEHDIVVIDDAYGAGRRFATES